ncbi:hypothetical protein P376_5919 [Streptomyces sp. HCCB10043]|nr:hypothetical protein P376_5919 [Streptomyces sp. HCCB10043]
MVSRFVLLRGRAAKGNVTALSQGRHTRCPRTRHVHPAGYPRAPRDPKSQITPER